MSAPWTPGPWVVSGEGRYAIVRGADARIVAVRHRLSAEEHAANARLIAEAPAMAELLERYLDTSGDRALDEEASALLARVKGEG